MDKLRISDKERDQIYSDVEIKTAHGDIYFSDHIRPVARNCFLYAAYLRRIDPTIDPIVCELGGLLHDIGYSRDFDSEERDHIIKGTQMAPGILENIGIQENYVDKITDTIRTHDGNLDRSRYGEAPINNKIVNDVDAMQLFDWNLSSLFQFSLRLKPDRSINKVAEEVLEHVNQTMPYISMPFFQDLAKPKYDARVKELQAFIK
ncbi:MAG TPA: HD domain-containing protein [Candidatus Pacearchaeota archaeon]|jgi:HD superfamily phosphodiesterase|nr:HD domain-containing protein [Candidatus Pacearchaeota archaeon]